MILVGLMQRAAVCQLALALSLVSFANAQEQETPAMPTWEEKIAQGFVPYRQLTVEDFKIDDQAHPKSSFWVRPFMDPHWHFVLKGKDGWIYAYVVRWLVFSGLDKNDSSRKSKFKEMKHGLAFAQAFLDLNEIHARQLAALLPGELPSGRGATPAEARAALQTNLEAFLKEKYQPLITETEAFVKATNKGANQKKVVELGKAIRKRLDAIPAPAQSPSNSRASATPVSSPSPQPSATPVSR